MSTQAKKEETINLFLFQYEPAYSFGCQGLSSYFLSFQFSSRLCQQFVVICKDYKWYHFWPPISLYLNKNQIFGVWFTYGYPWSRVLKVFSAFVPKMQRRPSGLGKELGELSERGTAEWAEIKSHGITQPNTNMVAGKWLPSLRSKERTKRTTVTQEICYELITYKTFLETTETTYEKRAKEYPLTGERWTEIIFALSRTLTSS